MGRRSARPDPGLQSTRLCLDDLKGVLVVNESRTPFVVSDDPAVHTNRLHVQKLGSVNFGIQQSGMMLTMPIGPRLAVLFYDGDVYTCPNKQRGMLRISSDKDAQAFNELQFLNANQNIYIADWSELEMVRTGLHSVSDRRIASRFRFELLIPLDGSGTDYVAAEDPTAKPEGSSIIHQESVSFRPRSWPSQLRFRTGAHGYSNGSAAGYLRRRWAGLRGLCEADKVKFA